MAVAVAAAAAAAAFDAVALLLGLLLLLGEGRRWAGGDAALPSRVPEPKVKPIPVVEMTDDKTEPADGVEAVYAVDDALLGDDTTLASLVVLL